MKRLLLFILFLGIVPHARADEAAKRAKIEELFTLIRMERLMQQVMTASEGQAETLASQMFGGNIPSELKPKLDDFRKRMDALIEAQLSWKSVEPDYVKIYADNFTEQQIDDVLAFYKSPTGQAFVEKTPTLTTQGMQLAQGRIAAIQPQLKQMFDDFTKEIATAAGKNTQGK